MSFGANNQIFVHKYLKNKLHYLVLKHVLLFKKMNFKKSSFYYILGDILLLKSALKIHSEKMLFLNRRSQ